MKAQGFILVLASVALGAMSVAGCSSDTNGTNGTGGSGGGLTTNPTTSSSSSTTGAGGNGGSTTSASTISGSSSSTGGGKDASELIGAQCGLDSDCGTGGICYKSTNLDSPFGAAVQNGYCSKSCTADTECGPSAGCSPLTDDPASEKVCIATCTMNTDYLHPGATPPDYTLDPAKCQGRPDLGCYQATDENQNPTGPAICRPSCSVDGCDGELVCDPSTGFCVAPEDAPTGTVPYGRACNPKDATDPCAGFCIGMGGDAPETAGFCTGVCVLGDTTDFYALQCGGLDKGFCAYGLYNYPPNDFKGVQDLGLCTGACKSQDDCATPDLWCNDIGYDGNGFCINADDCTKDSDCKGYDDPTDPVLCTDTASGKKCLDYAKTGTDVKLKYPLGGQTPTAGTGGGGAGGGTGTGTGTGGAGGAGGAATP